MVEEITNIGVPKEAQTNFLAVNKLVTKFFTSKGIVNAIDGVSFNIKLGEIYGLVGESGSGKSVTASSIMDIVQDPPGRIISGDILIDGFNILGDLQKTASIKIVGNRAVIKRNKKATRNHNSIMRNIRGKIVSIIFQEPGLSLNPIISVGEQISETVMQHSMVEMSESIIARYDLTEEKLETELNALNEISERTRLKSSIRYLCRKYGIPELSNKIMEAMVSGNNISTLRKEIYELVREQSSRIDIGAVEEVRDYYKALNDLWKLKSELIEADNIRSFEEIDSIKEKIRDLKSLIKHEFTFITVKMKLEKKRYKKQYEAMSRGLALEMLELVGIADPERILNSYPHELSGGMQQRVMIAIALSTNPRLLIADEPTTALDVTTQAQILDLIKELKDIVGSSILFITHDLAVIAEMCDRIGVMYAGNLVEESTVKEIFNKPKHPYTAGLLESIPKSFGKDKKLRLDTIPGTVPNLITPPNGCRFHPRCKYAMNICSESKPKLVEIYSGHKVACFLYSEESD